MVYKKVKWYENEGGWLWSENKILETYRKAGARNLFDRLNLEITTCLIYSNRE